MRKEYQIGQTFRYLNHVLVCVEGEAYDCTKCFLSKVKSCDPYVCGDNERKDGKNVIFKIDQRKTERLNVGVELCDKLIAKYKSSKTKSDLRKIKQELLNYSELIKSKNQKIEQLLWSKK